MKQISIKKYYSSISNYDVANNTISSTKLAFKIIRENTVVSAKHVNDVLAHTGLKISQSVLTELLNKPRLYFDNLSKDTIKSDEFKNNLGTYRSSIQVPGIYIWTHLTTGDKYVGSSSKLARRLTGYFNSTHKDTGKFIPLLRKQGLNLFRLEIIPIIESHNVNKELLLEQYFLLHKEYNLNVLKVVDGYSGSRSKPMYMYNSDFSVLIFSSYIREDFILKLGIHHNTFTRCIKTGDLYLGKYAFTDVPYPSAKELNLSVDKVYDTLALDRIKILDAKGRKIMIKSVEDESKEKSFERISDCVKYLNTIAPSNKTSLYRHIESHKPYQGYLCYWVSEKKDTISSKNIEINITHLPTNVTNTFSSLRKAALFFTPEGKTSGQILTKYVDTGKLFRGEYLITKHYVK